MVTAVKVLDSGMASRLAYEYGDDDDAAFLLAQIDRRKNSIDAEQQQFAALCDRWDNLYYPQTLTLGGADHWPLDPGASTPGKTHISLNVYPVYVDLPAALQAAMPIENMKASEASEEARALAVLGERLYFAWKDDIDFEVKAHRAAITKGLYGRTAAKVFWDPVADRPDFTVVDQPRNLWLGWSNSDYTQLDWALYIYRITPEEALARFGVQVSLVEREGTMVPIVRSATFPVIANRAEAMNAQQPMAVEVYDYWCRHPREEPTLGQATPMDTFNAIYVGNQQVQYEKFPEYDGAIPYIPVFNTYVPGLPDGRSEFYDIEPLIRDKDERLSQRSQFLHQVVAGQYWQLVGPEAPDVVPANMRPQANRVISPGAGNRIENIAPFFAGFEVEQHLSRLDRELADTSGLNDLLRGQAPSAVLSSSKAIAALVANYETRIRMKRDLYYMWRRDVWSLANRVWAYKDSDLRPILDGSKVVVLEPPSLVPRDDMEASTMAANLVNGKLWSQRRGMDRVGVEDPEQEQDLIREERTDATMYPADVQVQAQLLALLQQMGFAANQEAAGQAEMAAEQLGGLGLGGAGTPPGEEGLPAMNAPGEQPIPPEGAPAPPEGPVGPGEETGFLAQTNIREGEPVNRLLSQTQFGGGAPGG